MKNQVITLGLGAFGRLAASALTDAGVTVRAHDPHASPPAGVEMVSLDKAAASEFILLCVPVQAMHSVLQELAPRIPDDGKPRLVMDVCSVKAEPCAWMKELLPPHCEILGTHPLFGPQTAAEKGIAGEPIALCPVRISEERLSAVRAFCEEKLALKVHECTPQEHDEQMAHVQALTHLIGHALAEMNAPEIPELATLAYRRVLQLMHNVEHDSAELFAAIQTYNPSAASVRERFLSSVKAVMKRAEEQA